MNFTRKDEIVSCESVTHDLDIRMTAVEFRVRYGRDEKRKKQTDGKAEDQD
jgi:hypothetical protein